jgi:uncharacterized repeat protein (TIGR03943 family)
MNFSLFWSARFWRSLQPALDGSALLAWGALLWKYWLSGQLQLLIHPNYFGLVAITGTLLLLLGGLRWGLWLKSLRKLKTSLPPAESVQHLTLFPIGWASSLLLIVALISFWVPPTVLSAQVALQRGVSETLPLTQLSPQAFRGNIKPENRTLIDWIRTLNAYPEPDAYTGQKGKITGFVVHLPHLPPNYLLLSRFVLTCCAVDAYPVGIPIKLTGDRSAYPPDTWLSVEGEMLTESLPFDSQTLKAIPTQKRQLVLVAQSIQRVPTPTDPYSY